MKTFRSQNNLPDVYSKKSRDFQLFCNILDCMNGGLKYDIDSIIDIVDTNQCNERLITLLQTKLGFWTNVEISAEKLRTILKGFVCAVRNKGSVTGVEMAVQLFLKIMKIKSNVHIEVVNESDTQDPYTIMIGTEEHLGDTTILDEILKYIIPAGYNYKYVFYASTSYETPLEYLDDVNIITGDQSLLGAVRTTYVNNQGENIEYPKFIGNVNQTVISSNKVPLPDKNYSQENNNFIRNPGQAIPQDINGVNEVTIDETKIKNLYNEYEKN